GLKRYAANSAAVTSNSIYFIMSDSAFCGASRSAAFLTSKRMVCFISGGRFSKSIRISPDISSTGSSKR
ncbi:hypothetical protein, partial [Escherichia coli]|uniref:hypothetical protein n=1 Tax=Escherichia coli TaxID=562 RepID=UPI002896D138